MKSQRYQSKIRRGLGVLILRPLFLISIYYGIHFRATPWAKIKSLFTVWIFYYLSNFLLSSFNCLMMIQFCSTKADKLDILICSSAFTPDNAKPVSINFVPANSFTIVFTDSGPMSRFSTS